MEYIDKDELKLEIIKKLKNEISIVLATSADNNVTSRTMSHVNDELTIYFQTDSDSQKAKQIQCNKNISFAISNIQIESVAEICGHPQDEELFLKLYKQKYPKYYSMYSSIPNEVVIKAVPTKVSL